MVSKHCAHGQCKSDSRILKRDPNNSIFFVPFAKPFSHLEKCKKWTNACRRENFGPENVNRNTYICSLHFVGQNGPTELNPDPVSAAQSKIPIQRISKRHAVGDQQNPLLMKRKKIEIKLPEVSLKFDSTETTQHNQCNVAAQTDIIFKVDKNKQTCSYMEQGRFEAEISALKQKLQMVSFRYETCVQDPLKFKFYTSLSPCQFNVLWNMLGSEANNLRIWRGSKSSEPKQYHHGHKALTPKSQLFLTLIRLRLGHVLKDLSYRFNISISYASKIVNTWVMFLYSSFKKMEIFAPREKFTRNLPKPFRKFKNIRVIVDAFEMRSERSSDYREQGNMYSSYKAYTTYKLLCGIHPSGAIMFMSDAFEGAISDREIFKQSGIIDHLVRDDLIMADRGFNITDICNGIGCSLLIPPFLSFKNSD